ATGKLQRSLSQRCSAVAFPADGKVLAAAGPGPVTNLWALATGEPAIWLESHQEAIGTLALSPDGKTLTTGSGGEQSVRVWELNAGKERQRLDLGGAEGLALQAVAVSGDGQTLAVAGSTWSKAQGLQPVLWLAEAATGKRLRALEGHRSRVLAVAFSPDSKTLASGDNERNVCLWETGTGRRLHHLEHEGEVGGLTFSPTSKVL